MPQQCETPESTHGKPSARNYPLYAPSTPLVLKVIPTLSTVKMTPGIALAIPSVHISILGIQKLKTTPLALKIVTVIPMKNLIRVPDRPAHGLELDATLVGISKLCLYLCLSR